MQEITLEVELDVHSNSIPLKPRPCPSPAVGTWVSLFLSLDSFPGLEMGARHLP